MMFHTINLFQRKFRFVSAIALTMLALICTNARAQSIDAIGKQFVDSIDTAYAARDIDAYGNLFSDDVAISISVNAPGGQSQTMSLSKSQLMTTVPQGWNVITGYEPARENITVTELENGDLRIEDTLTEVMQVQGMAIRSVSEEVITLEKQGDDYVISEFSAVSSVEMGGQ